MVVAERAAVQDAVEVLEGGDGAGFEVDVGAVDVLGEGAGVFGEVVVVVLGGSMG